MIGRILGGRYEILEKIGEGGMATVYKAKCHLLNRYVAIKILKDEFIDDENFNRKFEREAQAAASLSHPNILNVYDVGVELYNDRKYPYIVMEYIKGKTLKDIIRENGKLTIDETIYYAIQMAEALKHAHSNKIIHRDIKPQNIMVTLDNRIKVTDFGIARAATSATMTTTSNVLGSVHYFSPEQARGGYTDEKSDIYSLGIVIYEMATGKLPYDGENLISVALKHVQDDIKPPRQINGDIPEDLERIILKCVEKNQSDRYSDLANIIIDLRNIEVGSPNNNLANEENFETKLMPKINDIEGKDSDLSSKDKSRKSGKRKNAKLAFLAILLALLLVSSLFYGFFGLKKLFKSEEILVPEIVGMNYEKAQEEIEKLGLKFEIKGYVKSDDFEPGQVTFQNIDPQTKVKKGFTIEVTVSEGQELVRVPGLINLSLKEAEEELGKLGLIIGNIRYLPSDTTPKDLVMKQEPDANTYMEKGSKINIVISEGEEIKPVLMPNLIDENIIDAQNKLLSLGLKLGKIEKRSHDTIAKDKVIWQSHESGSEIETNTVVSLYVSTGPEEKPDNNSDEGSQPNKKDEEKTISIKFQVPEDQGEVEVRIIKQDKTGEQFEVYKGQHTSADGELSKEVKGKPGDAFKVFFNDKEQTQFNNNIKE